MFLKIYLYILLSLLILFVLHFFFKWQIRKIMMRSVANKLGLKYIPKTTKPASKEELQEVPDILTDSSEKIRNLIEGMYNGKSIITYERQVVSGAGPYTQQATTKMLNIIIDDNKILVINCSEILFPLPGKIIKFINDYIENGQLPKTKKMNSALLLVILIFTILPTIIILGIIALKLDEALY